jgi:hypothetical protein
VKKILLTNNSELLNIDKINYDEVYTDSPYVVEHFNDAIYLDTLLDKNFDEIINNIRKKGYEINKQLINEFFPNYKNRNINILNIEMDFTNTFIGTVKLFKLIELYPNDEIIIGITENELYKHNSPEVLQGLENRFANIYYWIVKLNKIENIKLVCNKIKKETAAVGHLPLGHWILTLVNLDKKVIFFNFLKKINLISNNKKKIYLYKKNIRTREIEPYLYDLGYRLIDMPEIKFSFNNDKNGFEKIRDIFDKFFENNSLNNTFKVVLFDMYKKSINYYSQKEIYTEKYISKLDKSVSTILTNTISGFDSHIFAKQLQKNGYKIVNVTHSFSINFRRKQDFDFYECLAPDRTLCFNHSESELFKELVPDALVYPISAPQEAKNKRFSYLKRLIVNKMLKLNEDKNIFYPSSVWPFNNQTSYGWRQPDKLNYKFEKKMIKLLSNVNKRAIYKDYPMRGFIDPNPLIDYAKSFNNIKVINERYDFRFVSSVGDIFILGNIGAASTLTWMLGENKPIIFLYTNTHRFINEEGKKILEKGFIVVDIDDDNWADNLTSILNKPYKELVKIWKDKQIYRDQYDEKWLLGTKLHSGKLGSKYIKKFIEQS